MVAPWEKSQHRGKGLGAHKCLESPLEHQNLWYYSMRRWCKKGKMLFVVIGKCRVYVSFPPVNMPSVELSNSSHYKEVIFPPKKLRAGHWRKGNESVCLMMRNQRGSGVSFGMATDVPQLWGQPDRKLESPSIDVLNWWQWNDPPQTQKYTCFQINVSWM